MWFVLETKVRERNSLRVLKHYRLNVEAASRTEAVSKAREWTDRDELAEQYGDHLFDFERGRVFQMPEGWFPSPQRKGDTERLGYLTVTLAAGPIEPLF